MDVEPRPRGGASLCRDTVAARRSLTTSGPRPQKREGHGPSSSKTCDHASGRNRARDACERHRGSRVSPATALRGSCSSTRLRSTPASAQPQGPVAYRLAHGDHQGSRGATRLDRVSADDHALVSGRRSDLLGERDVHEGRVAQAVALQNREDTNAQAIGRGVQITQRVVQSADAESKQRSASTSAT